MRNIYLMTVVTVAVMVMIFTSACTEGSSFSNLDTGQTFQQREGSGRSKLDILWVMDNSGSMQSSQQNVADNLGEFIRDFQTLDMDFKMAVTTTDAYRVRFTGNHNCPRFRDGILNASCNTLGWARYTGVRVINRSTPDLTNVFMINALQTDTVRSTYGSGDERAFSSIQSAIEEPLNVGFLRADSAVAVIIVSDEDDFSHDTATAVESMPGYATDPWSYPRLHTIESYVSFLDRVTASDPRSRRHAVHAIAIFDEACRRELDTSFTGRKIARRYQALVDTTGGTRTSLCSDFAGSLRDIAARIITLATEFALNRVPIESSIVVRVNSTIVPRLDADPLRRNGWQYNSSRNSIQFFGTAVPAAGSAIRVTFTPIGYGS